jgi:EmrB/QacA subfamily drug resistance transporter
MYRHRWLALAILCTATFMTILDGTIVAVALPTIQTDLRFTGDSLSWVMDSYLVAFGGLLLLSGRLGDLVGRKRVFLAGIVVFVLASLACGLASGSAMLIAARFVQGAGAAMVASVTLGMIVRLFGTPQEQGKAIGLYAFIGAVGASAGLIIGGLLVQYASWRWIFLVNLPIGAATAAAGWRVLAADRGLGLRAGADALGAVLATSGIMLAVFAIAMPADWWTALAAAGLLAGFAVRQARARTPLLPPSVLASRLVAGTNVAQLFVIAAAMGFQVTSTLHLQRVLGYGPAAAGLGLLPVSVMIAVVSLGLFARLARRFGPPRLLIGGLVMITASLAMLTQVPVHAGYLTWQLAPRVLFGIGGGLVLPALATLGMSGVTDADAGVVSGLFNTTQQVGAALGIALLTSLATWRAGNAATAQSLTSGFHLAWATGAGLGAVSIVVAGLVLRTRGPAAGGPLTAPVAGHVDLVRAADCPEGAPPVG